MLLGIRLLGTIFGRGLSNYQGGKTYRRVPTPLSSTSPFSDSGVLGSTQRFDALAPSERRPGQVFFIDMIIIIISSSSSSSSSTIYIIMIVITIIIIVIIIIVMMICVITVRGECSTAWGPKKASVCPVKISF